MIVPAIYGFLSVSFAYLEDRKVLNYGLKLSFLILYIFSALRYDYGNDYMGYLSYFLDNQGKSISDIILFDDSVEGQIEPGWLFLNILFAPLGFFVLVASLSLFNLLVVYRFIKNYCPPGYYWFAVFYYFFQPYLMLVLLSAMRQAIAISLFLIALDYLLKRKILHYLLIIGLSYFFHRSGIFLIFLAPLALYNFKLKKVYIVIFLVLFFVILSYSPNIIDYITTFTVSNMENYYTYTKDRSSGFSVGVTFILMLFIYSLIFYYSSLYSSFAESLLFKFSILAFFIFPLASTLQMISRLNFYLNHSLLVTLPLVFIKLKDHIFRNIIIAIIVLFTVGQYYLFFRSSIWVIGYNTYQTIFSSPVIY